MTVEKWGCMSRIGFSTHVLDELNVQGAYSSQQLGFGRSSVCPILLWQPKIDRAEIAKQWVDIGKLQNKVNKIESLTTMVTL